MFPVKYHNVTTAIALVTADNTIVKSIETKVDLIRKHQIELKNIDLLFSIKCTIVIFFFFFWFDDAVLKLTIFAQCGLVVCRLYSSSHLYVYVQNWLKEKAIHSQNTYTYVHIDFARTNIIHLNARNSHCELFSHRSV